MGTYICNNCGITFSRNGIKPARHCSVECYAISRKGTTRPQEICKKIRDNHSRHFLGKKHKISSRKRMGLKGEKSPRWIGGYEARLKEYICPTCGDSFKRLPVKKRKTRFCSKICYGKSLVGIKLPIEQRLKMGRKGEKNPRWNGGQMLDKDGYRLIKTPGRGRKMGYTLESHLVVSKLIGRDVISTERVHHINGNILDNRPENLYLFNNQSEHMSYHCNPHTLKSNIIAPPACPSLGDGK